MTEGFPRRVVLYARVSTDAQAKHSYSVDGQLGELGEHSRREGHEVVAEVVDRGEKRHTLERPGIEELRGLCAAGGIDEVWAWRWDRFGESPWPEVLAIELEEFGVVLRSLDDGGVGEDADILRVLRSAMAKKERRRTAERSRMGTAAKARRGEIGGQAPTPRFGFQYVRNDKGKAVAYEVDPEKMVHVRRVHALLADGYSLRSAQREFEQGGVLAPGGGRRWALSTIKRLVLEEVYRPHTLGELENVVPADVLATLDPERLYGIAWSGQRRTKYKPGRGKQRVTEWAPREEWTPIPVDLSGSGLDRAVVDRARAAVANNKKPSKVGDRLWDLSGGLLRCGECGRAMHGYRRKRAGGGYLYYYRCRPATTLEVCGNRRSHPAQHLEYYAWALFDAHVGGSRLLELYDEAVEEHDRRRGLRDSPERRAALAERLAELELERKGYLRQNARGVLSDTELDAMLAELDEEWEQITAELRAAEDAASKQREKKIMRGLVKAAADQGQDYLLRSGEESRRYCRRLGAHFEIDAEGTLKLRLSLDLSPPPAALQTEHTSRSVEILPHHIY